MNLRTNLIALCLVLATPALAAPPFGKGGTDILHLTVHAEFAETDSDPMVTDAHGRLRLMLRRQGMADIQKLQIALEGLLPGAAYELVAYLRDAADPSQVDPVGVLVEEFTADDAGSARLKLMRVARANGSDPIFPGGGGFHDALNPLVDVRVLEVWNADGAAVLVADLQDPEKFQYLVKRRLDNESATDSDAAGWLFLKGHPGKTLFRLKAVNLDGAAYDLALNDAVVLSDVLTDGGRLQIKIKDLPGDAPSALAMRRVELLLGAEVVLGTDLP